MELSQRVLVSMVKSLLKIWSFTRHSGSWVIFRRQCHEENEVSHKCLYYYGKAQRVGDLDINYKWNMTLFLTFWRQNQKHGNTIFPNEGFPCEVCTPRAACQRGSFYSEASVESVGHASKPPKWLLAYCYKWPPQHGRESPFLTRWRGCLGKCL